MAYGALSDHPRSRHLDVEGKPISGVKKAAVAERLLQQPRHYPGGKLFLLATWQPQQKWGKNGMVLAWSSLFCLRMFPSDVITNTPVGISVCVAVVLVGLAMPPFPPFHCSLRRSRENVLQGAERHRQEMTAMRNYTLLQRPAVSQLDVFSNFYLALRMEYLGDEGPGAIFHPRSTLDVINAISF